MNKWDIIEYALRNTHILKMPKQMLSTFGTTNIDYYLLSELEAGIKVREGKVISERPKIIKPFEIADLFEGFDDIVDNYGKEIFEIFGKNIKMLNYHFKNQLKETIRTSLSMKEVFNKIEAHISKKGSNLTAIIKGVESTWQISIMKFIVDITAKSAGQNISDLEEKGMFPDEDGIPAYIKNKIEYLFKEAGIDTSRIDELGKLLNNYGLFKDYEDRFFRLFKK